MAKSRGRTSLRGTAPSTRQDAEQRHSGRSALITGAAGAIGSAIARELGRQGAKLLLIDIDGEGLAELLQSLRAEGIDVGSEVADLTQPESIRVAIGRLETAIAPIDFLVNNAGVFGPTMPVTDVKLGDWNYVLQVNLTAPLVACQCVLPGMIERGFGRIINIASVAGKGSYPLRAPYSVSKWGLIGLTRTLAAEAGIHGVTANAVCPGPVDGERIRTIIRDRAARQGRSIEDVTSEYVSLSAMKTMVTAEDVAAMVSFLASPGAARITGLEIDVAAGFRV